VARPKTDEVSGERLNKVLARAGVASRRGADELIADRRVVVNGKVVTEAGAHVDPLRDAIRVDGKRIPAAPAIHAYWMLNKPRGYVTTLSDPEGRPSVRDLVRDIRRRVFPVGRLDYHSEGLLLLTDDGELCRDLLHPSCGVSKSYQVKVRGVPPAAALARLRQGIALDGRRARATSARLLRRGAHAWLEIVVHEGRKHLVRRMCEAIGHPVQRLRRVGYGGIRLGALAPGRLRPLTDLEVSTLRRAVSRRAPRSDSGKST